MIQTKPHIIADKHIPYLKGMLESVANISYLSAADITHDAIRNADALIIRTRTLCNEQLLHNTNVRFIATATIGFDHIDTDYCAANNITWRNAPGCNANSVAQYISAALCYWAQIRHKQLHQLTIGIVGVGHVGSAVANAAQQLGLRILRNDPPLEEQSTSHNLYSLETLAHECDIISFHTPLTLNGLHPTKHLANEQFFASLKCAPLIINTARGGVIDEQALLRAMENKSVSDCIIDCWENEPNINIHLLNQTLISTPHIAGYSADGKATATTMSIQNINEYFHLGLTDFAIQLPPRTVVNHSTMTQGILESYPIDIDSQNLKAAPHRFEWLRSHYPMRREYDLAHK